MTALTWGEADREALDHWLELHQVARRLPSDADSTVLAEAALGHILPLAGELPEEPPFVGVHNPTKPAARTIEPWLTQVEALSGSPEGATLLANGVELGLLGVDPELDRRAARVIVDSFELEGIQKAMEAITRQALLDGMVGKIAVELAQTIDDSPSRRAALRSLCRNNGAYEALGALAARQPSLSVMSVYLWAMVDRDPTRRPSAARTMLMLDVSAGHDVRALWGENGPQTREQHAQLLGVYNDAEREPPEYDVDRALENLMLTSLRDVNRSDPLALALRGLPDHLEIPAYCAWYAAARLPGTGQRLDAWARIVARALVSRDEDVPLERAAELVGIAARQFIAPKTLDGYFEALDRLRRATTTFDRAMASAFEDALDESEDPAELIAVMFTIWSKSPAHAVELHDRVLAPGARDYRGYDSDVRAQLGRRRQVEWDEFTSRHGTGRFSRLRSRLSRRGR